jgi:hypothetical protein
MRRINRGRVHRDELRADAERRQEERATRSPREQLVLLDQRLGEGLGAVKERKKLQSLVDNPPPPAKKKEEKSSGG